MVSHTKMPNSSYLCCLHQTIQRYNNSPSKFDRWNGGCCYSTTQLLKRDPIPIWTYLDGTWQEIVLRIINFLWALISRPGQKSSSKGHRRPLFATATISRKENVFYPDRIKYHKQILRCHGFLCIKTLFNFKISIGKYSFMDVWCTGYPMTKKWVWTRP